MRRVLFFAAISFLFPVSAFCAPYLGKELEFHQPDGSPIAVRVWGDEFYIRAETLDGYSLVRDPVSGFICYAKVNNDESDFVSTGIPYTGQTVEKLKNSGLWPLAQGNGIKKGLRLKRQAVLEKAERNRHLLGRDQRGRILPAPDSDAFSAASAQAGSPAPLIGEIVGLTLLIQFPDVPATIPQADIYNYCNQAGYTGYGNNGSVRDYFYDVSNGNLTYTNYVTVYYTAQYNRSYYTDPAISYGTRARQLIQEALLWLDNPSGQNFNFGTISTDASNYMLAINAFYAGPTVNDWAEGLWPHMSSMYGMFTSNEGVKSGVYQITNIGSSLVLGTFCHENGHMICGYPDLYDYGYESYGAGNYCLMAYGGSDYNPIPPNPYLRDIKGWESVTVLPPHLSGVQYFLQSNSNASYKYLNPDNSYEYFYIDSRTKTGRNSSLPDDGLVIWHIDEDGSNDNQQMTPSLHYMVSVEQADGLFHLEYDINPGGSGDLFHTGYKDIFNDTTNPNAKWWNGANSNLVIRQISAVGSTMSFVYDDGTLHHPPVAQECSVQTQINTSVPITLVATDDGLPNPPGVLSYIITSLPSHGTLSDPGAGDITAIPYTLVGNGNQVIYTPNTGYSGSDGFTFVANDGGVPPDGGDSNQANVSVNVIAEFLTEGFESPFVNGAPPGWTKSFQTGIVDWTRNVGDHHTTDTAHGGTYNAMLYYPGTDNHETYLITPPINFGTGTTDATLEFWHKQALWSPDQDTLKVYYKTSAGGSWTELASYTTDVPVWTKQTISLPNPTSTYYIGFLGNAKYGYGVCIDDVNVTGVILEIPFIYVDANSPNDPGTGTQNDPFRKIQYGIDAAFDGTAVLVAEGRYIENINFNGKNIILTSTDPNDPNVVASTIIDGDNIGTVVTFNSSEDANCILDGFTITRGRDSYLYAGSGILCDGSSPTISNCIISKNSTPDGVGGGIGCIGYVGSPTIGNCIISENSALYAGGIYTDSALILTNCIIRGNRTSEFGVIYNDGGNLTMNNCTFAGNVGGGDGSVYYNWGNSDLRNCIFWGNVGAIWNDGTITISYSDIQGGWSGIENIDADPCFINPDNNDFHLLWDSPCIDAGDPNYTIDINEFDIDGDARVIGGRIDMGAYEYIFGELSDFSGDGIVNFEDFAILANYWMDNVCSEPDWCDGSDYDKSEIVDIDDLRRFCENWLWQQYQP